MIRQAKLSEISDIMIIIRACTLFMEEKGIYQWNHQYPAIEIFENDMERNELYVLEIDATLIGTIVVSTYMDEEYGLVEWMTPNKNNCYVHRLSIHPDHQGKGYAQQFMNFAENYAKENKMTSIRLDTFSQNSRNQKFYETRGYRKLSDIHFPKQSEQPFHCYELVL